MQGGQSLLLSGGGGRGGAGIVVHDLEDVVAADWWAISVAGRGIGGCVGLEELAVVCVVIFLLLLLLLQQLLLLERLRHARRARGIVQRAKACCRRRASSSSYSTVLSTQCIAQPLFPLYSSPHLCRCAMTAQSWLPGLLHSNFTSLLGHIHIVLRSGYSCDRQASSSLQLTHVLQQGRKRPTKNFRSFGSHVRHAERVLVSLSISSSTSNAT
jgi:hypothetical protein